MAKSANIKVDFKPEEAMAWMTEVEHLNQEEARLVDEVAKAIQDFKNVSEGSFADEIAHYGHQVAQSVIKIKEGMDGLNKIVKKTVDKVKETAKKALKGFVDAFRS